MDRANRGRRLPFAAPLRSGHRSRPRPRPELVCDGRGISSENETSWTQRAGPASHGRLATLPEQLRSEEHTSELQSRLHLVCRLLLEKKNNNNRSKSKVTLNLFIEVKIPVPLYNTIDPAPTPRLVFR